MSDRPQTAYKVLTADQMAALELDVQRIASSPYMPPGLAVGGGIYDVKSGRLELLLER